MKKHWVLFFVIKNTFYYEGGDPMTKKKYGAIGLVLGSGELFLGALNKSILMVLVGFATISVGAIYLIKE